MSHHRVKKTLLVSLLLMLAGLSAFWLASSPRTGGPAGYSVAGDSGPYGLYAPGTLDELPAPAAAVLIDALGLGTLDDYQDYTIGLLKELDITWVRIDFLYDGKRFLVPTAYLDKLEANGIEVVGCARSFVPLDAAELPDYQKLLGRLVADLPSVRVWQLDNEPNIGEDDPAVYLEIFLTARAAVADACPDCRIALAGAPVLDPGRQESFDYFQGLLAGIAAGYDGTDPPFDIFDIHYYGLAGESEELLAAYAAYEGLLLKHGLDDGVRIWMTECGTYTGQPQAPPGLAAQSEEQQAAELVQRFVVLLGSGAERVAWARFYENHDYTGIKNGYYDHSGLVYNGLGDEAAAGVSAGTRKQAFGAYRLLVAKTAGYAGVSRLAPGQYRFDFSDGRPPVYVVWAVPGTPLVEELKGLVRYTDLDGKDYESASFEPTVSPVYVNKL